MRSNLISPYHLTWVVQVDFKLKPSLHFLFLIVFLHPYEVPYHVTVFISLLTWHSESSLQRTVFLCSRWWYSSASSFILLWLWNKQTNRHTHSLTVTLLLPLLTACKSSRFSGVPCLNHDEAGPASSWDQLPCSQVSQWCHHPSCYAKHTSLWGTSYWLSRCCQLSATEIHLATWFVTRLWQPSYGPAQRTGFRHWTWTVPQEILEGCQVSWLEAVTEHRSLCVAHYEPRKCFLFLHSTPTLLLRHCLS